MLLALILFPLEATNQVIWVVSGSNAVENDSRLFLALVMFKRLVEQAMVDVILLELPGILTA